MRVTEGAHVLKFTLNSSLGLLSLYDSLGDKFHSDLVACYRMHCH